MQHETATDDEEIAEEIAMPSQANSDSGAVQLLTVTVDNTEQCPNIS